MRPTVCITFDDGYADNLWNAKPLLEQYEVPTTVFVTTGYISEGKEFWWDELERLVLWTPQLPKELIVILSSKDYHWHLGEWARLPAKTSVSLHKWHVECSSDPTPRHRAYRELYQLLLPLGGKEREDVLVQLRRQARVEENGRADYRALTAQEVYQLAYDGLVEVGSHTVTHPMLATQSLEVQQKEITQSKRQLEAILGRPITTFSYPYGGRATIGQETVQLVCEAGYKVACANYSSPVTSGSNLYLLPRYLVRDWDGEEFARKLWGFFHE